jgi:hypothetical protein
MHAYDRMRDDDPQRSYPWLREQVDRAIVLRRAANHRKDFARTLGNGNGRGAAAPIADKDKSKGKKGEACRIWAESGTCRFGDRCIFAHAALKKVKKPKPSAPAIAPAPPTTTQPPRPSAPAAPAVDPALAAKGKGKGKKTLKKAVRAAAATLAAAELAAASYVAAPAAAPPGDRKDRVCWHHNNGRGGCTRGDQCHFLHGPPGTLSPADAAGKGGGKGKSKGRGLLAVGI